MSLKSTYKEHILNNLLKTYLYDGTIPTSDTLQTDLDNYILTHKDLSLPKSKYYDFSVEHGDLSSVELNNSIIDIFSDDIQVLTKEIYNIALSSCSYYERWSFELDRLLKKSQKLQDRINSLLLVSYSTEGYFNFVGDAFSDNSLIDTENTTAAIDNEGQVVTIKSGTEYSGTQKQINLTDLDDSNINFSIVSQRVGTSVVNLSGYPKNIFSTDNSIYLNKVSAAKNGKLIAELKINLEKDINISKVSISSNSEYSNRNGIVSLQYSQDGYNWFLVPCSDSTQSLQKKINWIFSSLSVRWLKFIITKESADNDKNEYFFSFNSIKLFDTEFHETQGNLLYSNSLYATKDDSIVPFYQAELEVCETTPNDTYINYYLSASSDNSEWSNWYQVSAKNTDSFPKVINFSGAQNKNNLEDGTVIDSNYDVDSLAISIPDTFDSYNFKSSDYLFLNNQIQFNAEEDQDLIANSIGIWRNVYSSSDNEVRGIPNGWNLDGNIYTCYFFIKGTEGRYFDFGNTSCVIDGEKKSGVVFVSYGLHKFKTSSSNWANISNSDLVNLKTEEELENTDPLYPYNHKLLINGVSYPNSFSGERIYLGADISAESYLTQTSLFDLENNKDNLNYFSLRQIGQSSSILGIIVKINSSITDYQNEKFYITWKANDTISSYKYIKLKAELKTENTNITPKLLSYRIKLG